MSKRQTGSKLLISIHALRVEGDATVFRINKGRLEFLSTPSGWRATYECYDYKACFKISIHALRVEGDIRHTRSCSHLQISIHALRVEGDVCVLLECCREY